MPRRLSSIVVFGNKIEYPSTGRTAAARSCDAADLHMPFSADPALAGRMAARFAASEDPPAPHRMPAAALRHEIGRKGGPPIDKGVFTACIGDPDALFSCVHTLLYSALAERNARARGLLDRILADMNLPWGIRQAVLHTLGESYLFEPRAQDGALEVLLTLLDSEDPATRENAAFVLTSSIDKRAGDPASYVQRIASHTDKMAGEADRDDRNHRMLETLTSFLKRHCRLMPGRALAYLERVAALPESPHQPVISENIVKALGALRTLVDEDGRRRCITVLERFAAAGHLGALDALRSAGEA